MEGNIYFGTLCICRKRLTKPPSEDGQMELRSMMDRERETAGVQGVKDVVTCHTELHGHTELNVPSQNDLLDTQTRVIKDVAL